MATKDWLDFPAFDVARWEAEAARTPSVTLMRGAILGADARAVELRQRLWPRKQRQSVVVDEAFNRPLM